jgi:hypothetical protein
MGQSINSDHKHTAMPVVLPRPPRTTGLLSKLEIRQQWKFGLLNKYIQRMKSLLASTKGPG